MRNNLSIPTLTENDVLRIWNGISIGQPNECWEWTKGKTKDGYGRINIQVGKNKRKKYTVTRLVYFLTYNIDPNSLFVLHTCDNPSCCSPKHLWLGNDRDNNRDRETKNRGNHLCGESSRHVKLYESDILTIRNSIETNRTLAKQFGVSNSNIGRIRRDETWKHVGGPSINRTI